MQHCVEYRPAEECASAEVAQAFWKQVTVMAVVSTFDQVDFENQSHPLITVNTFRSLLPKANQHFRGVIELAKNEFTDNTDWLGLFDKEFQSQDFLSWHSYAESSSAISVEEKGVVAYPGASYALPKMELIF